MAELEALAPAGQPAPAGGPAPAPRPQPETVRDGDDRDLFERYCAALDRLHAAGEYERVFQLYLDGVERFVEDRLEPFLNRLVDAVAATGKRLLLVVFAGHGYEVDEVSRGHADSMSEGVLRVPFLVVGPDVRPGIHRQRVRTVDIAPTALELAGVPVPATGVFDGISLAAAVRGARPVPGDRSAVAECYAPDPANLAGHLRRSGLAGPGLRGSQARSSAPAGAGGPAGALRHVLLGQSAYLDDRKLVRSVHRYAPGSARLDRVDLERVERFGPDLVPRVAPEADPTPLSQLLDDYRAALQPPVDVPVDDSLRGQLRSLGYRI